jgi:hypothetical protein
VSVREAALELASAKLLAWGWVRAEVAAGVELVSA